MRQRRDVTVSIPIKTLTRMLSVAEKLDVGKGGRFCADTCATGHVNVAVYTPAASGAERIKLGCFEIDADSTDGVEPPRLILLTWFPEHGGSEELLWAAIQLLSGQDFSKHARR